MANTDYRAENPFEEAEQPTIGRAPPPTIPAKPTQTTDTSQLFMEGSTQPPRNNNQQATTNTTAFGSGTSADLDRKEMELARKKEDIERREKQLKEKEQQVNIKTRKKNWPRCKPFLYHDIREDIPTPELQSLVRKAYFAWFVIIITYFWNIITLLSILIISGQGVAIEGFFLGLIYAVFSIPVSFLVYRTLYNAAKLTSSSRYVLYFCLIWVQIAVFIILAIGIVGWGSGGFLVMLDVFKTNTVVGIFCVVVFILYVSLVLFHFVIFFFARREYVKAGGLEAAKKEAGKRGAQTLAENPELVKTAVKASV